MSARVEIDLRFDGEGIFAKAGETGLSVYVTVVDEYHTQVELFFDKDDAEANINELIAVLEEAKRLVSE